MKNKHRGSSFVDFLKEEGLFEECNAEAVKRVIAHLEGEHKKQERVKASTSHDLDVVETCSSEFFAMAEVE